METQGAMTPPSALSGLEQLPLHLLAPICEYIALGEKRKCSLSAFSLASKTCFSVAEMEKFRLVHISVYKPMKLRLDVQRWHEMLQMGDRLNHVRVLKISGFLVVTGPEWNQEDQTAFEESRRWAMPSISHAEDCNDENDAQGDLWPFPLEKFPVYEQPELRPSEEERKRRDEAWLPLIQLLKLLPGLQDLVYTSREQIPRCILSTLHENHPKSRLHMQMFKLRSLSNLGDKPHPTDPDELALLMSPCLYSIVLARRHQPESTMVDYHEDAILDMMMGLSPRLTNVRFLITCDRGMQVLYQMGANSRPPWQGFPPQDSALKKPFIGRIQNLFIAGRDEEGWALLDKWSKHTDFRNLRSLELRCPLSIETVLQLEKLAGYGFFANLQSLSLEASTRHSEEEPDIDHATSKLLQALSPLRDLKLVGLTGEATFDAIMKHHAGGLRKLSLLPSHFEGGEYFPSPPSYAQMDPQKCTQLEEVELLVPRVQGGEQELSVYRSLSRLPRLKHLTLHLYCTDKLVPDPEPANREAQDNRTIYVTHVGRVPFPLIQVAFLNAAIDSALALSIFRIVSRNRTLRKLNLLPGGWVSTDNFGRFMRWLGRKWTVQRSLDGEIKLSEVDVGERMRANSFMEKSSRHFGRYLDDQEEKLKAVWKSLWPPKSERWWDDWSSLPFEDPEGSVLDSSSDTILLPEVLFESRKADDFERGDEVEIYTPFIHVSWKRFPASFR